MRSRSLTLFYVCVGGAIGLAASRANAVTVTGVDLIGDQQVVTFDSGRPQRLTSAVQLGRSGGPGTGLQPNEQLVGIDFRATGQLYGVGGSGRLYTVATNGFVTAVAQFTDSITGTPVALNGTEFGLDFDPVTGDIRLVSNLGQHLSLDPDTAVATVLPNLNIAGGSEPNVVGLAYSNNVAGAQNTTLYGIDSVADTLVTVNPITGALTTVGALGLNVTSAVGFDILTQGGSDTAYASFQQIGSTDVSRLFTIDLSTGAASEIGTISSDQANFILRGLAVVPEPSSLSLVGAALLFGLRRRRSA